MDHPYIVKVLGRRLQTQPYFFVMPLYATSMKRIVRELSEDHDRIENVFTKVLDAVEYAHDQGVIHRDLNPRNVLMNSDDDLVVSDFGLGRNLSSTSDRLTQKGDGFGTEFYVAPEQWDNALSADVRSDVYSLGRILFELYTGTCPAGPLDFDCLPAGVNVVLERCTDHRPGRRYQSVADFKEAWLNVVGMHRDGVGHDDLDAVIKRLAGEGVASATIDRCLQLLVVNDDDPDVVHDAVMALDAGVVDAMFERNRQTARRVIETFVTFTAQQSWGFGYTDRIGTKCEEMFSLLSDSRARAMLTVCALRVGVGHNRWKVMEIAKSMMLKMTSPGDLAALRDQLLEMSDRKRWALGDRINLPKRLADRIKELFDRPDEEDDE